VELAAPRDSNPDMLIPSQSGIDSKIPELGHKINGLPGLRLRGVP